jgi:hypothetical protein
VTTPGDVTANALAEPGTGRALRRWCQHPKFELWVALSSMVVFYNFYFIIFFLVARVQPPPDPSMALPQIVEWFASRQHGLMIGFGMIFIVTGLTVAANALIAYSMWRMSVSRAFAYSYILIYSLSAVPGMLLTCIALVAGAMRPDRDPETLRWLYDFAFMAFDGTMGVFLIGSIIWMTAILLDKNRVLPKWFAYLNLCNALTEVVVAPAWIFITDVTFRWDGIITWWVDMVVFMTYTGAFITLLKKMIEREDFGRGPMPDLPSKQP